MVKRLLIDAAHAEETRVVVLDGTHLNAFDVESSARKQLKGNIYLGIVMRVEPSLQAAFVDFGGNRHGFLAFGDIHPDYYQIPVADREALLKERAEEEAAKARAEEEALTQELQNSEEEDNGKDSDDDSADSDKNGLEESVENDANESYLDSENNLESESDENSDKIGDDLDSAPRRSSRPPRYKIQEVIKRRQVLLVQVVKEERGRKGAALTTYLSLAGRYCVLMPNSARSGGVSRKISVASDRKKLRTIIDSLSVPDSMGLIVRTAGQTRTKTDIRGDYQYLMRLWESVRETTLKSTAPTFLYEDANLIKRAIRDLYSNDIPEVLVEGEAAYKAAKAVMKMLVPSHAKRVQQYTGRVPLFRHHQVEEELDKMHMPQVTLKSGGTIVINPTEALVAIDVNSGRATRERSIEATALKTNLEASEEIARQLSLRDLAGLIVIDYIDMFQSRNNHAVERRLKDSLKMDRARIQVGRISTFGLMELSRQRMRPSLQETSTDSCPICDGIGLVRSTESSALHALRAIENEGVLGPATLTASVPSKVAAYLLNNKRLALTDLEIRFGVTLTIESDPDLITPHIRIERSDIDSAEAAEAKPSPAPSRRDSSRRRPAPTESASGDPSSQTEGPPDAKAEDDDDTTKPSKRRRRGKRGGRRRRNIRETTEAEGESTAAIQAPSEGATFEMSPTEAHADEVKSTPGTTPDSDSEKEEKPAPKRKRAPRKPRGEKAGDAKPEAEAAKSDEPAPDVAEPAPADEKAKPKRRPTRTRKPVAKKATTEDAGAEKQADIPAAEKPKDKPLDVLAPEPAAEDAPKKSEKKGWWRSKI